MFKIRVRKLFEKVCMKKGLPEGAEFGAHYTINRGEAGFDVFRMYNGDIKIFVPERHQINP